MPNGDAIPQLVEEWFCRQPDPAARRPRCALRFAVLGIGIIWIP